LQKDNTKPDIPVDIEDKLQFMETRLEQVVGREVQSNIERVEQDMRLVEERLEQLCFKEIIRLRETLLEDGGSAASKPGYSSSSAAGAVAAAANSNQLNSKQQEVVAWLEEFGLQSHAPKLFAQGYESMFVMQHIIPEDLDALGVTLPGHRKALLLAVELLRQPGLYFILFFIVP